MKNITKHLLVLSLTGLLTLSCEKMLEVDSERFITVDKNELDDSRESLYTMMGALSKLQLLGDRYVILGELRADLMDVTANSDADLRALSNLEAEKSNPWLDAGDYYKVINHCNFMINKMDTSLVIGGAKVMLPEFAAAKVIRAWTYMQLALNFGKAYYISTPILTIDDALTNYQMLDKDAILDSLINDLEEIEHVTHPYYGEVGLFFSDILFMSAKFLLGDLYLWKNQYAKAAAKYHECAIEENRYVSGTFSSIWTTTTPPVRYNDWSMIFRFYGYDITSIIGYFNSTSFGDFKESSLALMTQSNYSIAPSVQALDLFENQTYSYGPQEVVTQIIPGDLRGESGSYDYRERLADNSYVVTENPRITIYNGDAVYLQRTPMLYLRYAEAVNQLNKPSLALAVVNYGLKNTVINDYVQQNEIDSGVPWLDFSYYYFTGNVGTRKRGQGNKSMLAFPGNLQTMQDSVDFVEAVLVEECALESAFQGNRFHDLMRMSLHNQNYSILAEAIAKKHKNSYDAVYAKMVNPDNWYLPYPDEE